MAESGARKISDTRGKANRFHHISRRLFPLRFVLFLLQFMVKLCGKCNKISSTILYDWNNFFSSSTSSSSSFHSSISIHQQSPTRVAFSVHPMAAQTRPALAQFPVINFTRIIYLKCHFATLDERIFIQFSKGNGAFSSSWTSNAPASKMERATAKVNCRLRR